MSNIDRRIDSVVERLSGELVHEDGTPADPGHVSDVVHAAADDLADAPIQDFVALLAENEARDVFYDEGLHRDQGLHRTPPEIAAGPAADADPHEGEHEAVPHPRY